MRALFAAMLLVSTVASGFVGAQEHNPCAVPGYLLFDDSELRRVEMAAKERRRIDIVVMGTGSSIIAGPAGPGSAYPVRLQAALQARLPGITVNVQSEAKSRQTAAEMVQTIKKFVADRKPDLVIWQTGTVDAMRGVDPESFRATLDDGVSKIHKAGADVILMNMQYSPRTESIIALGAYVDNMLVAAREREVPLFDRLAVMRHWSENGTFDLYSATTNPAMAEKVHDCVGRALATLIVDAAHLENLATKAAR
jgi:lysophospholipase L1-like esterase